MTDAYEAEFRRLFLDSFAGGRDDPDTEKSFRDSFSGRFNYYKSGVIPWLDRAVGLRGARVIEVGSGTGSSTEALLELAGHVDCFETDARGIALAEMRLQHRGMTDYAIHAKPFDRLTATSRQADGVLLAAILEHTTFSECQDILKNAWSVIRPNGWICIVDTPNRFCPIDHHTSRLPFFSCLPPEVRLHYAHRSPRPDFADAFSGAAGDFERLTRWGAGISYHEFELALGPQVHEWIAADGYEPEIDRLIGTLSEDAFILMMIKTYAPHVHRAFARRALHFVLRKPD